MDGSTPDGGTACGVGGTSPGAGLAGVVLHRSAGVEQWGAGGVGIGQSIASGVSAEWEGAGGSGAVGAAVGGRLVGSPVWISTEDVSEWRWEGHAQAVWALVTSVARPMGGTRSELVERFAPISEGAQFVGMVYVWVGLMVWAVLKYPELVGAGRGGAGVLNVGCPASAPDIPNDRRSGMRRRRVGSWRFSGERGAVVQSGQRWRAMPYVNGEREVPRHGVEKVPGGGWRAIDRATGEPDEWEWASYPQAIARAGQLNKERGREWDGQWPARGERGLMGRGGAPAKLQAQPAGAWA